MVQRGQESKTLGLIIGFVILAVLAFLVLSPTIDLFGKISGAFGSYQDIDTRVAACNGFAQQDLVATSYCDVNTEKGVKLNEKGQYVSCLYLNSQGKVDSASYSCSIEQSGAVTKEVASEAQAKATCVNLVASKKITTERALETTIVNGQTCKILGAALPVKA